MQSRLATITDAAAIARIYNQGIEDRIATFETRPRTTSEVEAWFDGAHPVVVVEDEGEVVAFASTSPYRPRECYSGIAEFSVYTARDSRGRGAGRLAMSALIEEAERAGLWKLVSRIFPENVASLSLMRSLGFREVGVYHKHARLDGVWRDVVIVERLLEKNLHKQRVLVLCTGNSARSQMAEGLLRALAGERFEVYSAGSKPSVVNPLAVEVMREIGIDISYHRSKHLDEFRSQPFDFVITVCDQAAEVCPTFPGRATRIHWSFPDPAAQMGTHRQKVAAFRSVRDAIAATLRDWLSTLPELR